MSDLHALIRLHKWKLDEKRRALAELRALADRLDDERSRLDDEIAREQDVVRSSAEIGFSYAGFARAAIERRRRLEQSSEQVSRQIATATEAVREAFQELKRFELAQEGRDQRERLRVHRKARVELDEIAVTAFVRRQRDANER